MSTVLSRSGVGLSAATPRSGPGLLCAAARFGFCRPQEEPLSAGSLNLTPAASATNKFKDSLGIKMTMKTFFTLRTE